MEKHFIIVQTAVDSRELAENLAKSVVLKGLAACVQLQKIESFYHWEGKIERNVEHLLSIKTRADLFAELSEFIRKNHSYEIPEILQIPVLGVSKQYLEWVQSVTQKFD
jgi:periplasmic divalent cation tolerance protein